MSDEKSITVTRTVDAPAAALYDIVTNVERHKELDGSGQIVSVEQGDRIQKVGQVFTMNMNAPHMGGDYKVDNHVVACDENKVVGWATAVAGTEPPGWTWVYRFEQAGPDSTEVTLTYDWSKVTDKEILSKVSFPLIQKDALEDTLANLASAAKA